MQTGVQVAREATGIEPPRARGITVVSPRQHAQLGGEPTGGPHESRCLRPSMMTRNLRWKEGTILSMAL